MKCAAGATRSKSLGFWAMIRDHQDRKYNVYKHLLNGPAGAPTGVPGGNDVGAERGYCGAWVGFDTILHCSVFPKTSQGVAFRGCMLNAVTVDVEEYFHPTEVQATVDESRWASLPSRIEGQLRRILQLLDARHTKATFFVLGCVAERNPRAIREIVASGHEIGCHSHSHRLVYSLTPQEFRRDTRRAVAAIEDACGVTPRVYRAPSYSITKKSMWAFEILVEEGFVSDSSIYPITHDRYGIPGSPRYPHVIETPVGPIRDLRSE